MIDQSSKIRFGKMELGPKLSMSTDNSPILRSGPSEIVEQSIHDDQSHRSASGEIESIYEISQCVDWIRDGGFQRVALQFPDSLLIDSVRIAELLEKHLGFKPFILADTSYGSCCVDEVAAQHVDAQCLIHYGDVCTSKAEGRIPIKYVFPRADFDREEFRRRLRSFRDDFGSDFDRIVLIVDVCVGYLCEDLVEIVESSLSKRCLPINLLNLENRSDNFSDVAKQSPILFVGETTANPRLPLLMMSNPDRTFFTYDVRSMELRREDANVNRMLKKRLYLVEKAKDAEIVGIVVGALSVAGYLLVLDRIKSLCRKAGKKFIVLSVGKINVAKLSNFADAADVFVWISCPFNIMLETNEYPHPIVTPFEFEVACEPKRAWYAGDGWITDFRTVLSNPPIDQSNTDSHEETDVSLITGKLRRLGPRREESTDGALISRSDAMQLQPVSVESRFLEKSWKGLEEKLGETEASEVREGRRGIASGYEDEAT